MVNYSQSIIYKLCCKDINVKEIYVGSTCNELKKRKNQHKTRCNNSNDKKYNYKIYQYIRANGGFNNWDMIEIEKYNCNDKLELHKQERYWLEELGATLNMCIPSRSYKEYTKDNKQEIQKIRKEYYEKNKQEINEKRNEKAKLNKVVCDICNKIMRIDSLNRHQKNIHNKV